MVSLCTQKWFLYANPQNDWLPCAVQWCCDKSMNWYHGVLTHARTGTTTAMRTVERPFLHRVVLMKTFWKRNRILSSQNRLPWWLGCKVRRLSILWDHFLMQKNFRCGVVQVPVPANSGQAPPSRDNLISISDQVMGGGSLEGGWGLAEGGPS